MICLSSVINVQCSVHTEDVVVSAYPVSVQLPLLRGGCEAIPVVFIKISTHVLIVFFMYIPPRALSDMENITRSSFKPF